MEPSLPDPPITAIYEDDPDGHRLAFVEILVKYLFEKTKRPPLLVLTREITASKPYAVFLKSHEEKFERLVLEPGKKQNRLGRVFALRRAVHTLEKKNIQRLLIPGAGQMVKTIGLIRRLGLFRHRMNIRAMLYFILAVYPEKSRLQRWKNRVNFWLERRSSVDCFLLDGYAYELASRKYPFFPAPIEEPPLAWEEIPPSEMSLPSPDTASGRPLCFGSLGGFLPRKGAPLLLQAFLQARFQGKPRLLLAGSARGTSLPESVKAAQQTLGADRIQHQDGFLDNETYRENLRQIDVVCLPYLNHVGPSGLFSESAAAGKITLVPNYGCLGWMGGKYNKNLLFEQGSVESLAAALEEAERRHGELSRIKGNYVPASSEDFCRTFCGF